ncbi:MAG: hypothetical protein H7039_13115, partial [Bryobacteraceae bacterium]|nr:hypothetical protein [Bryobacteraceae bacterium]
MRLWSCAVLFVALNLPVLAADARRDFRSFHLIGSAEIVGSRLRLTPAVMNQAGAAWFPERKYIAAGFDLTFRFQITDRGGLGEGADGIAFVIQDAGPDALAGSGSAGGFALGGGERNRRKKGIPHSVAVFFDTFLNEDGNDPSDNYVAISTNGSVKKMRWPPARLGATRNLPVFLKDG